MRTSQPGRLEAALGEVSRGNARNTDTRRLEGVLKSLAEVEGRRDGLIEMGADGIISREELRPPPKAPRRGSRASPLGGRRSGITREA